MGYFDLYKKKLKLNGGNITSSILADSKELVIRKFKDDPSYREGKLHSLNQEISDIPIRLINISKSVNEKKFKLLPDTIIHEGDYISYDTDKIFLITEFEDNDISPMVKGIRCNQTLNLQGWDKPIPCWGTNTSYGVKGKIENNYFALTDGKIQFKVQKNKYTDMIDKGIRFVFNNSKKLVYEVVEVENVLNSNIYTITVEKDEFDYRDDLKNNIAYNPSLEVEEPDNPNPPPTYSYNVMADNGDLSLKRYNANTFRIIDSYGNPVSTVWEITIDYNDIPKEYIEVKDKGNNYIKLINTKGYHANDLLINFKRNQNLLTAKIRMVN